ncbi:MAG: hypothetical protein JNJ48_01365 [Phycisphaerae bacterium]|nr:hypothetical protein [Phycisphaerae bacterium]
MGITHQGPVAERGVLYVATGDPYFLRDAEASIERLRALEPDEPVAVLSDLAAAADAGRRLGVWVGMVRPPRCSQYPSRFIKTRMARYSPFRTTLYLDCDIVPMRRWAAVFEHVRDDSIGAVADAHAVPFDPADASADTPEQRVTRRSVRPGQVQANAGVLLWRRGPVATAAFDRWFRQWTRFGQRDQSAFMRAQVPWHALPGVFNDQVQDDEASAAARGSVFWHPWSRKDGAQERALRRPWRKVHWWHGPARRAWSLAPWAIGPVRWVAPG